MTTTLSRVTSALEAAGFTISSTRPLPNGLGRQIRTTGGHLVALYDTGSAVPQGKPSPAIRAVLATVPGVRLPKSAAPAVVQTAASSSQETSPPVVSPAEGARSDAPAAPTVYWTDLPDDGSLPWG